MDKEKEKKSEINITNNYFAPIGQHIDHVDTINFRMDGDGTFHFGSVGEMNMEKKNLDKEKLALAIENCQGIFWGNSAYAVVFCVCRDGFKMNASKSAFERMIEMLPYKKKREFTCTPGTLANAFSDNPFYNNKMDKWDDMNVMERVIKLRDELIKQLEL